MTHKELIVAMRQARAECAKARVRCDYVASLAAATTTGTTSKAADHAQRRTPDAMRRRRSLVAR